MAMIEITATTCVGGGHVHASVRLNGGTAREVVYDTDDIRRSTTVDELKDAVRALLSAHCMGMTLAQVKTAVEAGVVIGIGAPAVEPGAVK